jgi:hypothetical protein
LSLIVLGIGACSSDEHTSGSDQTGGLGGDSPASTGGSADGGSSSGGGDTGGTGGIAEPTLWRIDISTEGVVANGQVYSPEISDDGRYAGFSATSSNLVTGDTNNDLDVFVRDNLLNTTTLISVSSTGELGNGDSLRRLPVTFHHHRPRRYQRSAGRLRV